MKGSKKSFIAILSLVVLMLLAILGLSAMTRYMEKAAATNIVIVTASPAPDDTVG